jgi:MFS family permease
MKSLPSRQQPLHLLISGGLLVALLAILFMVYELRHDDPVLQPRLFRHRSFTAACATVAFSNLSMYSTFLTLPILLAHQGGWSGIQIGFVLMTQFATSVVCAPLGGRLADLFGRRWPTFGGLALAVVGMFILALSISSLHAPLMLGGLALAGIGLGLSSAGMQTASVEAVGVREAGVAAGVYSTSRYLGSIIGSSVIAALLSDSRPESSGYNAVFAMIVAAAVVATITSVALHDRPQQP